MASAILVFLSIAAQALCIPTPEIRVESLESYVKFSDADSSKHFFHNVLFSSNNKSFYVGGMDFLYTGDIPMKSSYSKPSFMRRSDKLHFSLDDDPLFLCQQDDHRKIFCGSHVRLMVPISVLRLPPSKFYSHADDLLICATSGGNKGSSIYLVNGTSLRNLRQLNMETSSTLSDDDPFATPHELYFKARMLCPEFPEQNFAFVQINPYADKTVVWVVGLWLRKVGLQIKTFSDLDVVPYEEDMDKEGRVGALSAKLTSSLFQPHDSLLSGVGEFVAFNAPVGSSSIFAFLRQELVSRVLLVNVMNTVFAPTDADAPFEKTFNEILVSTFQCSSSSRLSECPRHGYCFAEVFKYPILRDVAIINDNIVALFASPPASWGARSAICVFSVNKLAESFRKCSAAKAEASQAEGVVDCDSASNKPQSAIAVFEHESLFTRLQAVPISSDVISTIIGANGGTILKGHLRYDSKKSWSFNLAAYLILPAQEKISNFAWHPASKNLFITTESSVMVLRSESACSQYLRIRHCMKDLDCAWNFDTKLCAVKPSQVANQPEKLCLASPTENVSINASQGSTVRLVCNPPCEFDASVKWNVPSEVDKNKYLIMDDILVMFDLFAGRSRTGNSSSDANESFSISCSAGDLPAPLVKFSINKTCGAFCQRNRNMEAWCLKTWKQKIGLPNGSDPSKVLRT